jgi:hypothetical protein
MWMCDVNRNEQSGKLGSTRSVAGPSRDVEAKGKTTGAAPVPAAPPRTSRSVQPRSFTSGRMTLARPWRRISADYNEIK